MDSPSQIATIVLSKLRGAHDRNTCFTRTLKNALEISIEASLLTDEGRGVNFSLLLEIDDDGRREPGSPLELSDDEWQPDFTFEPRKLSARDIAASSRISKAGTTFLWVQESAGDTATLTASALTRPPRHFRTEFFYDPRFLGITVLGPYHLAVEANGNELVYVRNGKAQPPLARGWPARVMKLLGSRDSETSNKDYVPLHAVRYAFERLGRAMWLAKAGGTIAILAPNEEPPSGDWNLTGEPLDLCNLVFEAGGLANEQARLEYEGPPDAALDYHYASKKADDALSNGLADLARFSQVDGAVVLNANLTLAAFGRKLEFGEAAKYTYYEFEDAEGTRTETPSFGGTRHKSAAHWTAEHPGRLALVASQDHRLGWFFKGDEPKSIEYHRWRPRLL